MDNFTILDITGDCEALIIRIVDENKELMGLWFENKENQWICLNEEVEKEFAEKVLNHEKVRIKILLMNQQIDETSISNN